MGGRRSALACGDEPADETDDGADEALRCLGKNRGTRNLRKEDEEDEWEEGERWDVTVVEDTDAGGEALVLDGIAGVGLEDPRCFIEERRGGGGSANGRDDDLS